jgi:rhodanese-related sulfurtransferase
MEILTPEEVRREGLPRGAHILEVVSDRTDCAMHPHFAGMECIPAGELSSIRQHLSTKEPIIVHCALPGERCQKAENDLERMGYENVFVFEGNLADLKTEAGLEEVPIYGRGEAVYIEEREVVTGVPFERPFEPPVLSTAALESLLEDQGDITHLINVVPDADACKMMLGVKCLTPADIEDYLTDLNPSDTIVLRCDENVDCPWVARRVREAGYYDVRLFQGDFKDISWLSRLWT